MITARTPKLKRKVYALTVVAAAIFMLAYISSDTRAATSQTVTQGASSNNSQSWTNPGNAHGTANDDSEATVSLNGNTFGADSASGDWAGYDFDTALPTDAEIIKVEVIPQYHLNPNNATNTLAVTALVNGSACTTVEDTSEPTTESDFTADLTSCRSWTRNDLLDANFETRITATNTDALSLAAAATFLLDRVQVRVTYDTPIIEQSGYRLFGNSDSTDVGSALAAQNTPATLGDYNQTFRVRILGHVTDAPVPTSSSFKLQYAGKGSGTCASPSGGNPSSWTDVSDSTLIVFNDNATPADNAALTTNANDPTHNSHTVTAQSYQEANNANVVSQVADGDDGMWDFSLKENNAPGQTTYCFRMATTSGGSIGSYTHYPEITTFGELAGSIVDGSGNSVSSPSVDFSSIMFGFECETATATFGVSSEKIRVTNTTQNAQWSLGMAASSGTTAQWSDGGANAYDFNDPSGAPAGCADGGDSDSTGGQLTVDPSGATITPQSGCTSSGISLGSSGAFQEGTIDSITLATAGSSAEVNCYWDITGISNSQAIPAEQTNGTYSIQMTITLTSV